MEWEVEVTRIAGVLIITLFGLSALGGTGFNASTDFSFSKNPNRSWQYGYSLTDSLDPSQFHLDEYANPARPIGFWHPKETNQPGPGYYPYVAYNSSQQTQLGSANGWAARGGEIAMEASNTGQYSIVRFVAPQTGHYQIKARFEGIHFGLSTTDVHVLHNRDHLLDAFINGYGGDPAFHKVQGASPAVEYSGEANLKTNDTIAFAVGYGENKTNYGDTTGLFATVTRISGR